MNAAVVRRMPAGASRVRIRPRRPLGPLPWIAAIGVAWVVIALTFAIPTTGAGRPGARAGMPGMPGMSMSAMPGMNMSAMPGMSMSAMAGMTRAGAPRSSRGAAISHRQGSAFLSASRLGGMPMWMLMVVAMMLPALLPAVRHVAANSLRWRRSRAMTLFVAAYVAIWTLVGVAIAVISPLWSSLAGPALAAGALALAAAWQLTPIKRAALADCHRPVSLPPRGRRADAAVLRFAWLNGTACVRSCWAMMLAMSLADSGMFVWMLAVTGMTTLEKRARRPRRTARMVAAALAGGAALVLVAS